MAAIDPWSWLLGRTAEGLWRHVPYQAQQLGQGQDPGQEPRVEVIRRLIAYPTAAFAAAVQAVAAAERPDRRARWLCYRDPGASAARPYWLCFVSERADDGGGRRFHVGLELFDRDRIGLWFFSGFEADAAPPELVAPFPARPEMSLPRLELSDADLGLRPIARWVEAAWRDALRFDDDGGELRVLESSADPSLAIDASITSLRAPVVDSRRYHQVSLRASRARLVSFLPMSDSHDPDDPVEQKVRLHPVCRLSTLIGRDLRSDVVLDHRNISAEHCRITWRDGVPALEEQGSKNGTAVGGVPVQPGQPAPLPSEARIELGGILCLFVQDLPETGGARRHQDRVDALTAEGRLRADEVEGVYLEASRRGITPGEVLLTRGTLSLSEWAAPAAAGGGCGASAALLALLLPLLLLMG